MYGLVDPSVPISARRRQFSDERLHGFQGMINSPETAICRDKLAFHSYCRDYGLPVPNLYALVSPLGSRTTSGKVLVNEGQWGGFVNGDLPDHLIVKPRTGKQGRDIRRLSSNEASLLPVLKALEQDSEDWLVQECLSAHDRVRELTGSSSISSVRIFTLMNDNSVPEIMDAYFRVICGDSVTDNISDYATGRKSGNIVATPDLTSGVLWQAWRANHDGVGYQWINEHPVSGRSLKGFGIPYWPEVIALVKVAATSFLPIRTAGWDVAITDSGPVLIEVNERFQNSGIGPSTERFWHALEQECERLRAVSSRVRRRHLGDQI
ncbi:hypothetical protein B1C78_07775 [Thioalkalivibrio denitrificans]|uniref:Alpha-L-glutamate ligase-related protein ATP-grasp domain-containing protein n=2 Tax=Thioalkalivibrio denitrificans TaxID=108003 RepID=A0A1V3NIJ5_9GAMM|nr:hypothetical protein B1C78_07775 [Thioalkalivibrio denitrificans]